MNDDTRLTYKQWQIVHELREVPAGYLASWHIAEILAIDHSEIAENTSPEGAYRKAVLELIGMGIIEEVPNLGCRYRLVQEQDAPPFVTKETPVHLLQVGDRLVEDGFIFSIIAIEDTEKYRYVTYTHTGVDMFRSFKYLETVHILVGPQKQEPQTGPLNVA